MSFDLVTSVIIFVGGTAELYVTVIAFFIGPFFSGVNIKKVIIINKINIIMVKVKINDLTFIKVNTNISINIIATRYKI